MTLKEISKTWKLNEKKVTKVFETLGISKNSQGQYEIPINFKTPYYPDLRHFKNKSILHIYIHVMNAIIDEKMIIPSLIDTDEDHVRTAVRELRNKEFIILLEGHEDDLNYSNYMVSMKYSDWKHQELKKKLEIIKEITDIGSNVKNVIS